MNEVVSWLGKRMIIALAIGGVAIGALAQPAPSKPEAGSDAEADLIKAILAKEIISIVQGNISAADRENGELNKLIRALSGVSVKDIEQFGVCGGPNSEVRKLLGTICGSIK